MKILKLAVLLAVLLPCATAQAQTYYIEGRAGAMWTQDVNPADRADAGLSLLGVDAEVDAGWLAAIAVGRDFDGPLRAEIEYSHRQADIGDVTAFVANPTPPPLVVPFTGTIGGDIAIDALMLNGYVDTPIGESPVSVYVGLGAGIAFTDTTFGGLDSSDTRFAFQAMLGAAYRASPTITVTAGYNLFVVEDADFGNDEIDITAQAVTAGVRFGF